MRPPRARPRPDHPAADLQASCCDLQPNAVATPFERELDDPGGLLRQAFATGTDPFAPDAAVLAWLAILPPGSDAPAAARRLQQRLRVPAAWPLTPSQARLLDLLGFVAAHRRSPQPS
jgi:hypothetical protein